MKQNNCLHSWKEKIYECCADCGQRHNQEHCSKCDIARYSKPLPCAHSLTNEKDIANHFVKYISQKFAYAPNPIDEEENKCMSARLKKYQGDLYWLSRPINSWDDFIKQQKSMDYFKKLNRFLTKEIKQYKLLPAKQNIFKALDLCPLNEVRLIISAQDPYIHPEEAMGLAFSVPDGVRIPPSLRNIFTELKNDLNKPNYEVKTGDLTYLARQGVLLVNSILTVREGVSGSHADSGWMMFTDNMFKLLNNLDRSLVFILWGSYAQSKGRLITNSRHMKLTGNHPSPLSCHRNFFDKHYFTQANEFLIKNGNEPIKWLI